MLGSFADTCVTDVGVSVGFYRSLLELEVIIDLGWYAELGVSGQTMVAFVRSGHETTPIAAQPPPRGVLVSFEVDDAAPVYSRAINLGATVLVDLTTELGQCHFMVADPDGAVVDIIERVPVTLADLRRLARYRRAATP